MRMLDGLMVDDASTIMLPTAIQRCPCKLVIYFFLDSARYHHAKLVQAWLTRPDCRIKLHFIPAYCPHLDPIERLWGLMHRNTTHNRCHATFVDFSGATLTFPRGEIQEVAFLLHRRVRQLPHHLAQGFSNPGVNGVHGSICSLMRSNGRPVHCGTPHVSSQVTVCGKTFLCWFSDGTCDATPGMCQCCFHNNEGKQMVFQKLAAPVFVGLLAILPVACAPQPAGMAAPAPASSLSGPANTTPAAAPMPGMDHSNMQGMDMNTMMAHCAQMRQGMRPGMAMSADMRQMMAQCDQMDRSMGMPAPSSR